jgi:tetratricopeptide (TPR) repeat protein
VTNLLVENCDPEAYLSRMEKQGKIIRENKRTKSLFAINKAAACFLLGDIVAAKNLLEEVDAKNLSERDGSCLVHAINLISCYYRLGEIENGELLFETKIARLSPLGKRLRRSVVILIGERYFYIGKFDQSYEFLKGILNDKSNKLQYLETLYLLAQIDLLREDYEKAKRRLIKIAKHGNKLWIAANAREQLVTLSELLHEG